MSSYAATADRAARERADATRRQAPLVEGPRWYRNRIRVRGPFAALIVPGIVGFVAYFSLQLFDTAWSGVIGLVGGVLAAPVLLLVGAPFGDRGSYPLAVLASAVLWMAVGLIAAMRATRNPLADWGEFWKQFVPLLFGVWAGVLVALVIATVIIGDTLF
ncbi:MAG: hypothetical protein QNM02_19700 [Acidimicrobiia bacterium]|nr:hypothetical protein [Acidimicrobiia bacterium]